MGIQVRAIAQVALPQIGIHLIAISILAAGALLHAFDHAARSHTMEPLLEVGVIRYTVKRSNQLSLSGSYTPVMD